jgi:glycosyltransferase involved in cell wall biosynthesis
MRPRISVIITAHNEGKELVKTIRSVHEQTASLHEVIVVDDGSTDGSCQSIADQGAVVIRHEDRVGVAFSRNHGCSIAQGEVLGFLDGHQRLSPGCFDLCADLACEYGAIATSAVEGLKYRGWTGYGADLTVGGEHGYFGGVWRCSRPTEDWSRATTVITPGYVMAREVYERVRWIDGLRGWGASEPAITVKAFFLGVRLLVACSVMTRHFFRDEFPFSVCPQGVWRNHALVARVCFDESTWHRHLLPEVFGKHVSAETLIELNSPSVLEQHRRFEQRKLVADEEFWKVVIPAPQAKEHTLD